MNLPTDQAHPARKYIDLKMRNLAFFKSNYPGIYDYFQSYEMKNAKLDVILAADEVDIISDNKRLYNSRGKEYAKREVATFLSSYDYGSTISTIAPLEKDAYFNRRRFALSISKIYEEYNKSERQFDGYLVRDFFPLMVFLGVGVGRHIEVMTMIRDIHHLVIFESDMDRFAASLFTTNWTQIAAGRINNPKKSINFILLSGADSVNEIYSHVWNHLLDYCPAFPVTTMFYNHLGNPIYDELINKINSDLYIHLFSFGNYDDELNQLNNALHNFRAGIPRLPKLSDHSNVPVCVVGSGPSLDARVDDLRQIADKAIIISCGTALHALYKHGLIPDIQVELESDYRSFAIQSVLNDEDFFRSVHLIGAAQLNPYMFKLFGGGHFFLKQDGVLANWFGEGCCNIPNAAPTCTNAALALCFYFGFPKILLFGMDFGFPDKSQHHASGTVYFSEEKPAEIETSLSDSNLIDVPAASGGSVKTTDFLFTSKRRVENLLLSATATKVWNCSDGVALQSTTWVPQGKVVPLLDYASSDAKTPVLSAWFNGEPDSILDRQILEVSKQLQSRINEFVVALNSEMQSMERSKRGYVEFCSFVNYMLCQYKLEDEGFYYFLRGSVWHFLLAGYTHVYSLDDEKDIKGYLLCWCENFALFIADISDQVERVFSNNKHFGIDEMVNNTISKPLTFDQEWNISQLEWEYQGYSVVNDEIYANDIDFEFKGFCLRDNKFVPYS